MTTRGLLRNSTKLINAQCGLCQKGLFITGDGTHPMASTAGKAGNFIFCDSACLQAWEERHCRWCGSVPEFSTRMITCSGNGEIIFCGEACRSHHKNRSVQ